MPETVSVIVPMRNEEENIDRCLAGLRAQDCAQLEAIVVDDCSTDGTAERLAAWKKAWPELQVVRVDADEKRWAGKTYALHRGIQASRGASLLFIDADVSLSPGAVARVVTTAWERRWPVLSVIGRPASSSLWEKAIVGCLMAWFIFFRIMRPDGHLLGAFIYIRRSLYDSIGGYGNVRQAIHEDTALARALADYGVQPRTLLWPDAYDLRMYSTWRQAFHGLTRVFINDFKLKRALTTAALIGASSILPVVCIVVLLASRSLHDGRSLTLLTAAILAACAQFVFYVRVLFVLGVSPAIAITKPFGDLVLFLAALSASAKAATGGKVTWRGRRYSKTSVAETNAGDSIAKSSAPLIPGGNRLSLVLSARGGTEAIESFIDMFRSHPEVEFIIVQDPLIDVRLAETTNVKIVKSTDTNPFGFERQGFLRSSGAIVAFGDMQGSYGPEWIQAIVTAFKDSNAQIVLGNTRYIGGTALSHAAWIRNLAQLTGLNKPVPRIAASNFGARREVLERYKFGDDLHGYAGLLLFATQVGMDGVAVRYVPEMVCRLRNPYRNWNLAVRHLRNEHILPREVYERGVALMDFPPFASRLFSRFLPLTVSFKIAVLVWKNVPRLCSEAGLSGTATLRVLCYLVILSVLDYHVSWYDVVVPPGNSLPDLQPRRNWEDAVQRGMFRVVVFYGREYNHDN